MLVGRYEQMWEVDEVGGKEAGGAEGGLRIVDEGEEEARSSAFLYAVYVSVVLDYHYCAGRGNRVERQRTTQWG